MNELQIFETAQAIFDAESRRVFLDRACGGDAKLRARVEAMLGASIPGSFLHDPIVRPSGDVDRSAHGGSAEGSDPLVGTTIGGVRVVRLISEGGMGRVYEGIQESPRRTVAVKVVKEGLATPSMLRRFEYEAQTLARLRHPGIAEIHFAGTFQAGETLRPFFVMEYIANAKALTAYADEMKLSTNDRLALFRKVCDAVAHGHQNSVTHRDLKPGNILVDTSGQPKVIDFGVAKTTDADVLATVMGSDVGKLIGTYQYMSPEQFDADPHAIDIRSDVYALGVVLHELLTGRPPYDLRQRALDEIARIVKHDEPPPITTINKALRKDVGVIAGKCLEKDRNRRYSSASELSADVGRFLAGDPIAAVAPGLWDGVGRLARKHKAAAAALAGIAASLVAAVVGISAFAVRAERERAEARRQKTLADAQRGRAEAALEIAKKEAGRAEVALETAAAESLATKRQLYSASLARIGTTLDRPNRRFTRELVDQASVLFQEAFADAPAPSIELAMIGSTLDDAMLVLDGHEEGVRSVAVSPSGALVATASDDHTACLWDAVSGRLVARLAGHSAAVVRLAFSPDGTRLATASEDNTARLWDAATGEEIAVLAGHERWVESLAYSPDGTRLATASLDGTARLWDAMTGKAIAVLGGAFTDGLAFSSPAFSPDGTRLAALAHGVRVWNVSTGLELDSSRSMHFESQLSQFLCLAFSHDGTRLFAGGADRIAAAWDVQSGQRVATFEGQAGWIRAIASSPDGSVVATGSDDRTACLWDAVTGRLLSTLKGHADGISGLAFLADGSRLATVSRDGSLRLWHVPSGDPLAVLRGHEAPITSLAVAPDGTRLVTGAVDGTARIWDAAGAQPDAMMGVKGESIVCLSFSRDGRRLATGTYSDALRIWDCRTAELLATFPTKGDTPGDTPEAVAYSPDGSILAATGQSGATAVRDARTGELIATIPGEKSWCWAGYYFEPLAFSPDGARLITAPDADTARVWDAATGKLVATLGGHARQVVAVAYSPDGSRLATADLDGSIRLWDGATHQATGTLSAGGSVNVLVFSPDSRHLAASMEAGEAQCWDVATGDTFKLEVRHEQSVTSLAYSPDGRLIATSAVDGTAWISDATTGKAVAQFEGHEGPVTALAFSPDCQRAVTVSSDDTARLWMVSTGELLAVLRGHEERITTVRFSPDGTRLATGSDDGTARLWGLSNAEIHANRLASAARRTRLGPLVDGWFAGDLAAVKGALAAAEATLPPDDWHEASNMVLERAAREAAARSPETVSPPGE